MLIRDPSQSLYYYTPFSFNYTSSKVKWSEVAQLCPTLCDPKDCSLPGSSIHGIFQARVLEWIAISFSRGSSRPRDGTRVSRIAGRRFTIWATREAHTSSKTTHSPESLAQTDISVEIWFWICPKIQLFPNFDSIYTCTTNSSRSPLKSHYSLLEWMSHHPPSGSSNIWESSEIFSLLLPTSNH